MLTPGRIAVRRASTIGGIGAAGAARVGLGALWLHEGLFKYDARFGAADILLVANSAGSNSRVPGYFKGFADWALRGAPGFFGAAVPLLETVLGVALLLGVVTLPATVGSVLTLTSYWSADQLIGQYPVMLLLSAGLLLCPVAAARLSVTSLLLRRWHGPAPPVLAGPLRRWL